VKGKGGQGWIHWCFGQLRFAAAKEGAAVGRQQQQTILTLTATDTREDWEMDVHSP